MKRILLLFIAICSTWSVHAQLYDPVSWKFDVENVEDNEATVVITASIQPGWHVYSQYIEEGGPIPTSFSFEPSDGFNLIGKVTESPKAVSAFDPNFDMQIAWHEKTVSFKQKVKLNQAKTIVKGMLEFMVCNDKSCLPPEEVPFSVSIDASKSFIKDQAPPKTSATVDQAKKEESQPVQKVNESRPDTASHIDSSILALSDDTLKGTPSKIQVAEEEAAVSGAPTGLWSIFIAGLIGGFAAFLMPCIYPMVPLTTSFFTKQSGSRSKGLNTAILYGISIVVIYVALGMIITLLFGASALNEAASSAVFNLLFFAVILIFAISFLGAFEITLPASFVNKMDEKSNRGGFMGIFFMAFTLALVSFSCTGPIIGYLLVDAVSNGALLGPAIGMLGFSVALAIPFILFAAFPAFLKEMPKSGGWLNTVKVSLGFLELALAFKFLSNVDLAYHWGILDREIFLAIWIVIFGLFGMYLLGKLKLSHDGEGAFIALPRLFAAMVVLAFTIYMIPGMWGAPLKGISAWLPPQTTQDFDLNRLSYTQSPTAGDHQTPVKKYGGIFHAPHGLEAFYDYEEGLAYAKKVNKPVLLDFTGWSCVNCRKMEASVWSDPEVLRRLREDYVLISLYVDDKTELDESEQYTSAFSGKKITTIGKKWSDLQASTYQTNSQPYYVVVGADGKKLIPPQAFDLDITNYIKFLDSGKTTYNNRF